MPFKSLSKLHRKENKSQKRKRLSSNTSISKDLNEKQSEISIEELHELSDIWSETDTGDTLSSLPLDTISSFVSTQNILMTNVNTLIDMVARLEKEVSSLKSKA